MLLFVCGDGSRRVEQKEREEDGEEKAGFPISPNAEVCSARNALPPSWGNLHSGVTSAESIMLALQSR